MECKEKTEEMVILADDLMDSTSQLNLDESTELVAEETEELPEETAEETVEETVWETDVVSEVYKTPVAEEATEQTMDDLFGEASLDVPEEETNRVLAELGEETK